jgi:hypothetical protein
MPRVKNKNKNENMQKFYMQRDGKNRSMGCLEFQIKYLYCKRFNWPLLNTFNGGIFAMGKDKCSPA